MKFATVLVSAATFALATAAPAASADSALSARGPNLIFPHATFRYWINSGKVKEDPQDQLLVVKDGNPVNESSTIVTFQIPAELKGKRCKLNFDLWKRDHSTGTHQMDVFSVINPPGGVRAFTTANIATVRPASSRDKHRGRVEVYAPGSAKWLQSYDKYPYFNCPAGQLMGVEYVGVGDRVEVRWDIGVTGPRVQVV